MTNGTSCFYFDSSIILRYAVNHERALKNLSRYATNAATSALTTVECLRVLDRWRITNEIDDKKLASSRSLCLSILSGLRMIAIDQDTIELASQSFPIAIKSLDAIHLATAIQLKRIHGLNTVMLTHDQKLMMAAISINLDSPQL
jgi:predicted nucleic acid-binding protein